LRLFNRQLAGQISWFLPLAFLCMLPIAWRQKLSWPIHAQHKALILWAGWLLPQVVFFSFAGLFHRYYLEMVSPAIAALVGAGLVAMWKDYQGAGTKGWLLPLATLGAALTEIIILIQFPDWARWLAPIIVGITLLVALLLIVFRLSGDRSSIDMRNRWAGTITALGLLALLIAPAVWSLIPVWYGGHSGLPHAGPELLEKPENNAGLPQDIPLLDFLLDHHNGEEFILATLNARTASPYILLTGEPVMAMGGFSGNDPILSINELAQAVDDGDIRFFLLSTTPQYRPGAPAPNQPPRLPPAAPGPLQGVQPQPPVTSGNNIPRLIPSSPKPGARQQSELLNWIRQNCRVVPQRLWSNEPNGARPTPGLDGSQQLWDCSPPTRVIQFNPAIT
jgi:4-amino-4-deoxy-L-arabinose transferase-like glycosyltransferase